MKESFFKDQYALVDLSVNYWWIVGFKTEEEFKQIAEYKLKLLQDCGFTYEKSLLDVGCGTGLIPSVIYDDMIASYLGLDIMSPAVEFCRTRYPRFNFAVSQEDSLLIKHESFDFIVFYSVFTHSYAKEVESLLRESVKHLNDDGKIVADFFIGNEHQTTREMVPTSRYNFEKILNKLSLNYRIISDNPFNDTLSRILVEISVVKTK